MTEAPIRAEIIRGVEEVANREGYLTIVANTERRPDRELRYVRKLRAYHAEGLIFAGGGLVDPASSRDLEVEVAAFVAAGSVVVATTQHQLAVPHVCVDGAAAAALAARHLLDLGHIRIGIVAGPRELAVSHTRTVGFQRALAEAGLTIDPSGVVAGDFTRAGGEAAAAYPLDLPQHRRPTAIFAADDQMAIGALTAAHRRGLVVPDDLSVVVDTRLFPAHLVPRASTAPIGGAQSQRAPLTLTLSPWERELGVVRSHRVRALGCPPAG